MKCLLNHHRLKWHAYLDHLDTDVNAGPAEVWSQRRRELMVNLLYRVSITVGYSFSKSEIGKDIYYLKARMEVETDQAIMRRSFAKMLSGDMPIPMAVKEFPISPEVIEGQETLRKLITEWLEGNRVVKVEQQ